MVHKQTGDLLDTNRKSQGSKWIFVMSTCKKLYAGEKKKGLFHHSSFLAGGATLAAGRLMAECGKLKSVSAYSGHYRPTEENLDTFLSFLKDNGLNLAQVQVTSHGEDYESCTNEKSAQESNKFGPSTNSHPQAPIQIEQNQSTNSAQTERRDSTLKRTLSNNLQSPRARVPKKEILQRIKSKKEATSYQLGHQLSLKWSTGAGPRIGCVADYPKKLRAQALEFVNLSSMDLQTPLDSQGSAGFVNNFTNFCRVM